MTDLERRAMLGDRQAQEELSKQGYVIKCPLCGGEVLRSTPRTFWCRDCNMTFSLPAYYYPETCLEKYNTRPAPPIGRCGECSLWYEKQGICTAASDDDLGIYEYTEPDHFCGYFKQKKQRRSLRMRGGDKQ